MNFFIYIMITPSNVGALVGSPNSRFIYDDIKQNILKFLFILQENFNVSQKALSRNEQEVENVDSL